MLIDHPTIQVLKKINIKETEIIFFIFLKLLTPTIDA